MIFKRPWLVFLIFIGTLVLAAVGLMRVWQGLQLFSFLDQLPLSISPLYLVVTGSVWMAAFGWAAIWVWIGRQRAPALVLILGVVFSIVYWLEQLLLMISPLRQVSWPFKAVFNAAALLIIYLIFRHPVVRRFFGGIHE